MNSEYADDKLRSNKTLTMVIYGLYAATLFIGFTWLVAIIINYVKRDDVRCTYLESHFDWQIKTFWFSLFWSFIGLLLCVPFLLAPDVLFAFPMLACALWVVTFVWYFYRVIKGFIRLSDNRPMYTD